MSQTLMAIIESYFQAFQLKDLDAIAGLLAEQVTLVDWEISVKGKQAVLDAVANIFKNIETIKFNNLIIHQTDGRVFWCQFELVVPEGQTLHIVDKITLDSNNKIISVEAFKR